MRLARSTGAGAGLLIVVLGVWGALIPFVGPYFNYGFGPNATWHFTMNRLWLDILPGAIAVVGGLWLLTASRRVSGVTGGWLAVAAGAWFLVGPSISMLWGHAGPGVLQSGIGAPLGGHDRAAIEAIGFFYGLGALITAFAAFAVGRFASRPALATDGAGLAGASRREAGRERSGLDREPVFRRGATARRGAAEAEPPPGGSSPAAGGESVEGEPVRRV